MQLLAAQGHHHRAVQEWVKVEDVLHSDGAGREEVIAHATIVFKGNVAIALLFPGITHHHAQGIIAVDVCLRLSHHALKLRAALEVLEQGIGSLGTAFEFIQADVFSLLAYHLAAFNLQCREGDTGQLVAVLRDQDAAVQFAAFELGVGVATDDEVIVGELLGQLHIDLKAHMGEQHIDIALLGEPFVLRNHFLGELE